VSREPMARAVVREGSRCPVVVERPGPIAVRQSSGAVMRVRRSQRSRRRIAGVDAHPPSAGRANSRGGDSP
jgi:hypothetical protein